MKHRLSLTDAKFRLIDELECLEGLKRLREADDYQMIRIGAYRIACYVTDELIEEQREVVNEAKAALQAARDVS